MAPNVAGIAAFVQGVTPHDLIKFVDSRDFTALCGLVQCRRGLFEASITDAVNRAAVLVDLKELHTLRVTLFRRHGLSICGGTGYGDHGS